MYFPPNKYGKVIKISSKWYIADTIELLTEKLNETEMEWFYKHPQFKHIFHLKNPKHKWTGTLMLAFHTAKTKKRKDGSLSMAFLSDTPSEKCQSSRDCIVMLIPSTMI